MIPIEDLTDFTLAIEDTDEDDEGQDEEEAVLRFERFCPGDNINVEADSGAV